jgi:hypothetical protein
MRRPQAKTQFLVAARHSTYNRATTMWESRLPKTLSRASHVVTNARLKTQRTMTTRSGKTEWIQLHSLGTMREHLDEGIVSWMKSVQSETVT